MDIGVPRETRPFEFRVGLSPAYVSLLTQAGHTCYIERDAGIGSGFRDSDYEEAGGRIVYSADEAFGRAELILKVSRPTLPEIDLLVEGQTLLGFLHMASARPDRLAALTAQDVTAIAYERIQEPDGALPVLKPLSQVCGRMAAQVAANLLQNDRGGNGILISGAPGVPPAEIVIIGAGTVGTEAARLFLAQGAHVTMLDRDLGQLQKAEDRFENRITSLIATPFNLERVVHFADVVVGAILVPGARTPVVVTREMVRSMKPRTVILDLSIDDGGCVETSRPTSHLKPTFMEEGVIHYCVPNVPGAVARTSTHAYLNAAWPYIQALTTAGIDQALDQEESLRRGLVTRGGRLLQDHLQPNHQL